MPESYQMAGVEATAMADGEGGGTGRRAGTRGSGGPPALAL